MSIDLSFIKPYVELLYEGTATIKGRKSLKDNSNKLSHPSVPFTVIKDVPCHVDTINQPASETRALPKAEEMARLFIDPDIEIKPGSHVIVVQHGKKTEYAYTSVDATYCDHQEILMKKWKEYL